MPTARYFIVHDRRRVDDQVRGEEYGPYKTQTEAMVFAIDAAQKLGAWRKRRSLPDGRQWPFPAGMDFRPRRLSTEDLRNCQYDCRRRLAPAERLTGVEARAGFLDRPGRLVAC